MKIAKKAPPDLNTPAPKRPRGKPPTTVDGIRAHGVAFAADDKITLRERAMLLRDYRRLDASERPRALEALRASAPRAAAAVTPMFGPATLEELQARVGNDIAVGPTTKPAAQSKNGLTRAGVTERSLNTYFRLGSDEQLRARQLLVGMGFSEADVRELTTPRPARPSWSAFANPGKFTQSPD